MTAAQLKLYIFQVAPNPTKVRLYIAEQQARGVDLGVIEEVVVKLPKGEQRQPEHLARNPFGKLPVLEIDDDTYINESLAIIEYLDETLASRSLWGEAALSRAQARELERIVERKVLDPIGRIIHATRSPLGLPPEPTIATYFKQDLPTGLDYIDALLADGRSFVFGEDVTVADCTLAAALQFMRFAEMNFIEDYTNIMRWDMHYRGRAPAQTVLTL